MHREKFSMFVDALNASKVTYVFIRGFVYLPKYPDTDVDVLIQEDQFDTFMKIAKGHLSLMQHDYRDFGFAEWCTMLYAPFFTEGSKDSSIPNGCFRVDAYNSLYFLSPYKSFTSNWTLPKDFNNAVLRDRQQKESFFIPRTDHEITLLVCRNVFDKQGQWSQKHIERIVNILPTTNKEDLADSMSLAGLPTQVADKIFKMEFDSIFDLIMKGE